MLKYLLVLFLLIAAEETTAQSSGTSHVVTIKFEAFTVFDHVTAKASAPSEQILTTQSDVSKQSTNNKLIKSQRTIQSSELAPLNYSDDIAISPAKE
ncbi:MAG TPA: hypothetical protein VF622_19530, partial [Segetibacter sp.]